MQGIHVIDSHTGGEPTRVVTAGIPDLGNGSILDKSNILREKYDWFRSAIANEPRGHEAMVGALLLPPDHASSVCGVVFFNNHSTLHMCIHGTIGLAVTLAHMGKISCGEHAIDTPVGTIKILLESNNTVSVTNVPSYRYAKNITVSVDGYGDITGDIAWGGNWFFLINEQGPDVHAKNLQALTHFTSAVKNALHANHINGKDAAEIDHIETFSNKFITATADSKNFVLCPGNAYDRSPCGTGTSAKLACLAAAGVLREGELWKQSGILDSIFQGSYTRLDEEKISPTVKGQAWITGESHYILDDTDPMRFGF